MHPSPIRVAVIGATGYGGAELVRLLAGHPRATVTTVTSGRSAGKLLRDECPWLATDLVLSSFAPDTLDADVALLAQESGFAMEYAPTLSRRMKVIDLSADFRLKDPAVFESTYGRPHACPDLPSVYGLPELVDRRELAQAQVVANPGCYPTASLLALVPLIRAGLVAGIPTIDAKSGVSGAGRSKKETDFLFSELAGGFKAYAVTGHRHIPEIEQQAGLTVRFVPHLIPSARGIHATVHVPLTKPISTEALRELYREATQAEPFLQVQDTPPSTKQVQGSNRCILSPFGDERTQSATVLSVIDNLVKGAAGQAIQNMNLLFGLPETTGLPLNGVWP